jgi:hypothetical protein
MKYSIPLKILLGLSSASPLLARDGLQFHSLEAHQQNLPTIKLPYGTWQATKYDSKNDVCVSLAL